MQFWDGSALLPLIVRQARFSTACRRAFRRDMPRAIAFLARSECRSAVERLAREGALTGVARRRALAQLDKLLAAFDIVVFSARVAVDRTRQCRREIGAGKTHLEVVSQVRSPGAGLVASSTSGLAAAPASARRTGS